METLRPPEVRELDEAESGPAFAVMAKLRSHVTSEEEFVERVNARQRPQGYRLIAAFVGTTPVAVAGFRVLENLATGRHLYVDDLVTREEVRGQGHAARLFAWLREEARVTGCAAIHLDCGVQRRDAHRFYFGQGMHIGGYHFERSVATEAPDGLEPR